MTVDIELLTMREKDVLAAMAAGQSNTAIAGSLFISRKAVEKHVNSIFSKLLPVGREARDPRVHAVLTYLADLHKGGFSPPVADTRPARVAGASRPRCFSLRPGLRSPADPGSGRLGFGCPRGS